MCVCVSIFSVIYFFYITHGAKEFRSNRGGGGGIGGSGGEA